MTLSRFLRDYLYIPLGGSRQGVSRRYVNLMLTMVLGGLWHGAGWNFVIWGGLHGCFLTINHGWSSMMQLLQKKNMPAGPPSGVDRIYTGASSTITFFAVCFAWVFFRASTLDSAWQIVQGMTGCFGTEFPEAIAQRLGGLGVLLGALGVQFVIGGATYFAESWSWIAAAACLVFFCPNSQQILASFEPALETVSPPLSGLSIRWRPTVPAALLAALLFTACLLALNRPSEFLYFQF